MRRLALCASGFVALCSLVAAGHAHAALTVAESPDPIALPGFTSIDLSGAPLGVSNFVTGTTSVTMNINTAQSPNQGVAQGSLSCGNPTNCHAPPVTDSNGDTYTGKYFSTGLGSIMLDFAGEESAVALLWGSVDAANELELVNKINGISTIVGTVMGSQITPNANGFQGYGGSFYTLVTSDADFNEVVLSSGYNSFESAELQVQTASPVPEPATAALLGAGLLGLVAAARGRRARVQR